MSVVMPIAKIMANPDWFVTGDWRTVVRGRLGAVRRNFLKRLDIYLPVK
jgi:hypothetical protein